MHPTIHFQSRLFDLSQEPANPINPIAGVSVLDWLRARLPADMAMSGSEAEDWGWYCTVNWQGRSYLIGASAHEDADGNHEWIVQIEKHRSLKERLLGRAKLDTADPCFLALHGLIAQEPAFTQLSVEPGA